MEQNLDILRQEIVDKSLEAFREGLFSGHERQHELPASRPDEMLITPTSVRYDVLRAQDIVHMKLDGTVLEGELQPSSEWRMHAAVYKAYGETNAVFHTHSPYATAFAVVRKSIPAVLIESCIFLGGDHPLRGLRRAGDRGRRHERHPCAQGPRRLHACQSRRARRGEGPCAGISARGIHRRCCKDLCLCQGHRRAGGARYTLNYPRMGAKENCQ